jgi:hypothetical protein
MANLIRLSDHRRQHRRIFFSRKELNLLLGVYSRRVASGEWRDYAIDQQPGMAVFSVFRSSLERPVFSIAKCAGAAPRNSANTPAQSLYVVFSGRQKLKTGKTLEEVVEVLDRRLEVVSG